MNRVSTSGNYAISLANLGLTQQRQIELGRQVSSQKVAQDLKGYAHKAETLTSIKNVQARVLSLIDQNAVLADRFATQDVALNQVADSALGVREAIANALASGRADTLMEEVRGFFTDALQGLNTKSQGRYLFAGGQINTQPVTAQALSDLGAPATVAATFKNDQFIIQNQIDETGTIDGGMLANVVGGPLFDAFKTIQDYSTTVGSGPFTGALTEPQKAFLQGQLTAFDGIHENLVNTVARNGTTANRIDGATKDLTNRAKTLETMVGGITNVDMPTAISNLELAKFAVEASAQVFIGLRDTSLLNFLR